MKAFLTTVFALLFITINCCAQKLNFKSYSVSDGLPQAQVHDLAQTDDGYIWMATYGGGLAKFDGKEFTNYTKKDGLRDNSVEKLFVDSKDNIWIASDNGGVAKFRRDSLVYPFDNDSLSNYAVVSIAEDRDGNLWFGTYKGGIFIQQADGDTLHRLTKADGLPSNIIRDFLFTDDDSLWIATRKGVSIYHQGNIKNYTTSDGLSSNVSFRFFQRSNGKIWISTANGVSIWNGESFEALTHINGDSLGNVYDILEGPDGDMWIGTSTDGIYISNGEKYNHITKQNGLNSDYIYKFFKDHNDNIWIATDEDGVNLYKDDGFIFYNKNTGLHSNKILSVYRDRDNTLWLGSTQGLESFDGEISTVHPLPGEYENNYIWNIEGLPNGKKLIAMPDGTLMKYDGNSYSNFSKKYGLGKLFVYSLMVDSADQLWICSDNGLYKISLHSKDVTHFSMQDGLANETVYNIFEDSRGRKWISTYYGLNVLEDQKLTTIRMQDGLIHNQINYITEDDSGNVWIGTRGGISVIKNGDYQQKADIRNFGKSDGMTLMNTHFLWFDKKGHLWQGTNGGLQKLNVPMYWQTGNMSISHYALSKEGLGLEFNFNALDTNDQQAWLGSMEGVVQLTPAKLKRDPLSEVQLTQISANTKPVEWEKYTTKLNYKNGMLEFPSITFPPSKNIFEFHFRGLSYTNPENVVYRYKLQGFDSDWMPVTADNSAIYTNLSPGDYTFVVEAKYSSGNFANNKTTYDFSVGYPFWRTYWFYGLIMLAVVGGIYGYIRIRINYLEKNRLKELVDEQTEHLQDALAEKEVLIKEIHHRVKNNLAVISGLLELQMGHADNDFANKVLSESQRRVQSISMIHEKLYQSERLAEIDFEKYVRELIDIVSYSFSYPDKEISVEVEIDDFKLGVDQGIPCGLILNELVSNAFEHAFNGREEGNIWITFEELDKEVIRLSVRDNGVGLAAEVTDDLQNSNSLGMVLVDTLTNQLDGTLEINQLDSGTEFLIDFKKKEPPLKVPIHKN